MTSLVRALKVLEVGAAISDHLEKTAARVVILLVRLEVLCKLFDAGRKDSDLNAGRTRVSLVDLALFDDCLFLVCLQHTELIVAYIL